MPRLTCMSATSTLAKQHANHSDPGLANPQRLAAETLHPQGKAAARGGRGARGRGKAGAAATPVLVTPSKVPALLVTCPHPDPVPPGPSFATVRILSSVPIF